MCAEPENSTSAGRSLTPAFILKRAVIATRPLRPTRSRCSSWPAEAHRLLVASPKHHPNSYIRDLSSSVTPPTATTVSSSRRTTPHRKPLAMTNCDGTITLQHSPDRGEESISKEDRRSTSALLRVANYACLRRPLVAE